MISKNYIYNIVEIFKLVIMSCVIFFYNNFTMEFG